MPNSNLECEVSSCTFWIPTNVCAATRVSIADQYAKVPAGTECQTFIPRNSFTNVVQSISNLNWPGIISEPFNLGKQINPIISCSANNCTYWAEGDICTAKNILISGMPVSESPDSQCSTFAKKDSSLP